MLPELLYREWILNRTNTLLIFGMFMAFNTYAVIQAGSARVYVVFACIYAAFLGVTLFVREDKFRATGWSCTLPVTRRELVRARFVASWIAVLSAMAGALLLAVVVPGSSVSIRSALSPSTLLVAVTILTLVLALMQPFTIRFGFVGLVVFLVGLQVLGVAGMMLAMWAHRVGSQGGARSIGDVAASIVHPIVGLRDALSPVPFALLVLVALALVHHLGYRLAVALFARKEF